MVRNKNIKIVIIDYGMSNMHSVQSACKHLGYNSYVSSNNHEILTADVAILPGVGSFGVAIKQLNSLKLTDTIKKFIDTGKLFIGICLGMQLLFSRSREFGLHKGLSILNGEVKKFPLYNTDKVKYPIPQVGWNKIKNKKIDWEDTLLSGIKNEEFMYFVHSYYVKPEDSSIILSETSYAMVDYSSSIKSDNVYGFQFHPEKSSEFGLIIYKNILNHLKGIE